jgi:hypothetical protein
VKSDAPSSHGISTTGCGQPFAGQNTGGHTMLKGGEMARTILIPFIVFLGGCAASIPEGMPTAMLRFTADGYMSQIYPVCPGDRSLVKVGFVNNQLWSEVSPVKMLGTRPDKNGQVLERLIPAGRPVGFAFTVARDEKIRQNQNRSGYSECSLIFVFTPTAGEQYHADYQWPKDSSQCFIKLSRLSDNHGKISRTEVPVKIFELGMRNEACRR